ncbi:MAG: hypothetical protein KAR13_11630, partial [Desulfobulbaceae bacterium]|nr:hypothetical protein [Desulfobulbaceae bacterium]
PDKTSENIQLADKVNEISGKKAPVKYNTKLGGLFYLLNIAMELNLGEILWQACLPESIMIARALATLLGEQWQDDAALQIFSGSSIDESIPDITVDQQKEVCRILLVNLCRAIPRYGFAEYPIVHLELIDDSSGRLLIAREPCSPFCLFAWPANSHRDVMQGLDTFLKCWSQRAPNPQAVPQLAELDVTGRIQFIYKEYEANKFTQYLIAECDSPRSVALISQITGSLCYILNKRIASQPTVSVKNFISDFLVIPATLKLTAENIVVEIDSECIHHGIRKIGADKNPGWVPWLQQKLEFHFSVS